MEDTSINANPELVSQAEQLTALYEQSFRSPFPYKDVRMLLRKAGAYHEGLIADLDLYFSTIAGYGSWGKRVLNWNIEKRKEAFNYASRSFFDRHPEYQPLQPLIVESELSKQLENIEEMRITLLRLLTLLNDAKVGSGG